MGKDKLLDVMDKTQMTIRQSRASNQTPEIENIIVRLMIALFSLLLVTSCASLPRIIVFNDPLTPQEHINLGLAYQKDGETDHATAEFKTAAKKFPDAYVYLGNLYFENNDMEKAEKYYRKAIAEKAGLGDAYNNLAWLYFTKNENLEEAKSLAQKAVAINPDNPTYKDTLNKIKELKASE